jgi:hypothetical protein
MLWLAALGAMVVLAALAWWSSGRAKPLAHDAGGMSQTEKDHLDRQSQSDGANQICGGGMHGLG